MKYFPSRAVYLNEIRTITNTDMTMKKRIRAIEQVWTEFPNGHHTRVYRLYFKNGLVQLW